MSGVWEEENDDGEHFQLKFSEISSGSATLVASRSPAPPHTLARARAGMISVVSTFIRQFFVTASIEGDHNTPRD